MLGRVEVMGEDGEWVKVRDGREEREFWDPNKENLVSMVSCKVGGGNWSLMTLCVCVCVC